MKGLDLKEPFQKAAVTVSAPGWGEGGMGSDCTPFILQTTNETRKSHAFVFAVVSWVETLQIPCLIPSSSHAQAEGAHTPKAGSKWQLQYGEVC